MEKSDLLAEGCCFSKDFNRSLTLMNMDCSLMDKNTISIIRSPTKQFYFMAAIEGNEFDQFYNPTFAETVSCNNELNRSLSLFPYENGNDSACNGIKEELSMDRLRYSASETLLPLNSSTNNSGTVAVEYSDTFSSSSEAVFDAEIVDQRTTHASCDDDQPKITQDVVRAVSLAQLFDPVYIQRVHHRSEGCLDSHQEKMRRAPRKYVRKSKSVQNNCYSSGKDLSEKLCSEMHSRMQTKTRRLNAVNVSCDSSDVSGNNHQRSQHRSHVSVSHQTNDSVHCQLYDRTEDSKTSGNEEKSPFTSDDIISTGHESTNIDQAWDGYQVPLYTFISDDSTEEKLDASGLQGDWQQFTDEYADLSDFGNVTIIPHCHNNEDDSDTDVEELHHLIKESSDALHLTKLSLAELKRPNGPLRSTLLNEPLATCKTNINCLRDLLDAVQQNDWTVDETVQLSDLLKQWEDVESEFLQLTFVQDLSISKSASDVIINLSPDDSTHCTKTNICPMEVQVAGTNSNSSSVCSSRCHPGIIGRFDAFISGIHKLLKDKSPVFQLTMASVQTFFFVLLFLLLISYVIFNSKCVINMMEIRVDPQLRYVIGPPPS